MATSERILRSSAPQLLRILISTALFVDVIETWINHANSFNNNLLSLTLTIIASAALWHPITSALFFLPLVFITPLVMLPASIILPMIIVCSGLGLANRKRRLALLLCLIIVCCKMASLLILSGDLSQLEIDQIATVVLATIPPYLLGFFIRSQATKRDRRTTQLQNLARTDAEIRSDERAWLSEELRESAIEDMAKIQSSIDQLNDVKILSGALFLPLEQRAKASLASLRSIVGVLRSSGGLQPQEPRHYEQAIAAISKKLHGMGIPTRVDITQGTAALSDRDHQTIQRILQIAADFIQTFACPDSALQISIRVADGQVMLNVRSPVIWRAKYGFTSDAMVQLQERLRLLGGSMTNELTSGIWNLAVTFVSFRSLENSTITTVNPLTQSIILAEKRRVILLRWIAALWAVLLLIVSFFNIAFLLSHNMSLLLPAMLGTVMTICFAVGVWRHWIGIISGFVVSLVWSVTLPPSNDLRLLATAYPIFPIASLVGLAMYRTKNPVRTLIISTCLLIPVIIIDIFFSSSRVVGIYFTNMLGIGVGLSVQHFTDSWRYHYQKIEELRRNQEILRQQERDCLARELHDVVAHQLTIIVLHTQIYSKSSDQQELRALLARLATASANAEKELMMLLHVMTSCVPMLESPNSLLTPTRVMQHLANILETSGFECEISVPAFTDTLPADIQRTICRILQEATTNITRYASQGLCSFVVTGGEKLTITVMSPLASETKNQELSGGFGLRGIRERVDLQDGSFEAGPVAGCWVVSATLPLSSSTGTTLVAA